MHILPDEYFKWGFYVTTLHLGFFDSLLNLWTLLDVFLLWIQPLYNTWGELVSSPTKVFTEPITSPPEGWTKTKTFLNDRRTTDDEPDMIRAVFSFEVLTIFRGCRDEIRILLFEKFRNVGTRLPSMFARMKSSILAFRCHHRLHLSSVQS